MPTTEHPSPLRGGDPSALLASLPPRITELLRRWAGIQPDAPALLCDGATATYGALLAAVDRLAARLAQAGVRAGDRVMVVNENGFGAVALIFAAATLDAWAAPVNARMSAREIAAVTQGARARLTAYAIAGSAAAAAHAGDAARFEDPLCGAIAFSAVDPASVPEPVEADGARQVAALVFTSGTTGAPKGVMVSHRTLLYSGANMAALRGVAPGDVFLNVSPVSHIIGLATMLMTALWAGACTRLVTRFSAAEVAAEIRAGRITYLLGVPTLYARLLEQAGPEGLHSPALRFIGTAGAPLDLALKARIEAAFGLPLGSSYAMTECVPITRSAGGVPGASLGEAQPGIAIRLVREDGGDAAEGETGEIWVKGPPMMLGYYRDAAATAAAFRAGGWLATGDLGRCDGGALSIVGRSKDVIIRSGFNVYPIEVEAVLMQHPAVAQAAVVGRPAEEGNEEVLAYVQLLPGRACTAEALLDWAREGLAAYKRPAEVRILPELPIGPTGKVLKIALRS